MNDFAFFLSDEFKSEFNGRIKINESIKNYTTFRIGGNVPVLFEPEDEKSLILVIKKLKEQNKRYFLLGGGSNVVMSENIDFAIVSTKLLNKVKYSKTSGRANGLLSMSMKFIEENKAEDESGKRYLNCDAGANWGVVCRTCTRHSLTGFENFSGLPGTVGGAVFMNARCFGFSTSDNLISVRYLDLTDFEVKKYEKNSEDWGYKKSPFQTNSKIVLSVEFEVEKDTEKSEADINAGYMKMLKERALKKHFEAPSAGSVFKNIPEQNVIAGKVIEECGLKGTQIGGAKVADWHGNFIINEEDASSTDVKKLVEMIQEKVKSEKNIDLKCEIIFVPESVDI